MSDPDEKVWTGGVEEIGRELQPNELLRQTIVVLRKDGGPGITMWVAFVGQSLCAFYSGRLQCLVIAAIAEDGSIRDDKGQRIRVFEYLGER